ncbi:MAG: FixH family protein [Verrucomicrobia bacterium]|nr:FixH family protein [Verrucomicrobiota bacterium]
MSGKARRTSLWPKVIIGYFSVVIICIAFFLAWVLRQNNDLVRPDYYAEELRHQDQLDRVQRTRELNGQATIAYDMDQQQVTVAVPQEHIGRITTGVIHFYRPSDAKLDKNIKLELASDGAQHLDVTQLEAGLWKVRLFWTLNDEEFYFDDSILISGKGA